MIINLRFSRSLRPVCYLLFFTILIAFLSLYTYRSYKYNYELIEQNLTNQEQNFTTSISLIFQDIEILGRYASKILNLYIHNQESHSYDLISYLNEKFENQSMYWDSVFWIPSKVSKDNIFESKCGGIDKDLLESNKQQPWHLHIANNIIMCPSDKSILQLGIGATDDFGNYLGSLFFGIDLVKIYEILTKNNINHQIASYAIIDMSNNIFLPQTKNLEVYNKISNKIKEMVIYLENSNHSNKNRISNTNYIPIESLIGKGYTIKVYQPKNLSYYIAIIINNSLISVQSYNIGFQFLKEVLAIIVIFLTIIILFEYIIIYPILQLAKNAEKISQGDNDVDMNRQKIYEFNNISHSLKKLILQQFELIETSNNISFLKQHIDVLHNDKSQFMRNVQHNLRTPLHQIIYSSNLIVGEIAGPIARDYVEYAKIAEESGKDLLRVVNNMITAAEINSGKIVIQKSPVKLSNLLQGIAGYITPKIHQYNLSLHLDIDCDIPPVLVDSKILEVAIINILNNSIIFNKSNGEVHIILKHSISGVVIEIKDTGIGISEKSLNKLLNILSSNSKTFSNQMQEIMGLGLLIAYNITQIHNSTFSINSILDKGTIVSITIPNLYIMHKSNIKRKMK